MAASTSTTNPSTPTNATERVLASAISAHLSAMIDGERVRAVADEPEDVDADLRGADAVLGRPAHGQASQARGLGRGDRLERVAVLRAGAGLHLTDDMPLAVVGDDVELAAAAPPVAFDDRPAQAPQIIDRGRFAATAETASMISPDMHPAHLRHDRPVRSSRPEGERDSVENACVLATRCRCFRIRGVCPANCPYRSSRRWNPLAHDPAL